MLMVDCFTIDKKAGNYQSCVRLGSGSCLSCNGSFKKRQMFQSGVVIDEASMCKNAYQHVKKVLQELKKSIHEINEKEVMEKDDSKRRDKGTCHEERYLALKNAKTKGRPKRLKSSKEKAKRKPRLCRGCGRRDVAHNMRNCPMLVKRVWSFFRTDFKHPTAKAGCSSLLISPQRY
ncbi:hypothetical protein AAC387_Pa10g1473 [Persea americana]